MDSHDLVNKDNCIKILSYKQQYLYDFIIIPE